MIRRSKKESDKFATNPGSRFYEERHGVVQEDGTIKLVVDNVIDLQEKYNAEYPSTTIENILANCSPLDNFADDGKHGIDTTNMPKTYAEFLQVQIDQKLRFDRLPVEIKEKFGNDFNQYLVTAGSEEWMNKLGIKIEENAVDKKEDEVKE